MASGLKEWYYAIEDKYYDLMDSLEDKMHVYEWFVNPLEDKGVPSFPVFVLIVLALIAILINYANADIFRSGRAGLLGS